MGIAAGEKRNQGRGKLIAALFSYSVFAVGVLTPFDSWNALQAETLGDEYSVKGAYLLNFAKFTTWRVPPPRTSERSFAICTWKTEPLKRVAAVLETKTVFNLPVKTKVVISTDQISTCDILFVSSTESGEIKNMLPAVNASGTLLISEQESSGMISFIVGPKGQIQFSCHLAAAEKAGIKFSSQLISLAVHVEEG